VYNVFNANTIITENNSYGTAAWRRPTGILDPRIVEFVGNISF